MSKFEEDNFRTTFYGLPEVWYTLLQRRVLEADLFGLLVREQRQGPETLQQ